MHLRFVLILTGLLFLPSCRTTKEEDERVFTQGTGSTSNVGITHTTQKLPPAKPGTPPAPTIPEPATAVEEGVFYVVCAARDGLPGPQALTIKAMLAAMVRKDCAEGELWLRSQKNKAIRVDSEALVELQTLAILESYPHIADVYIKAAKGVARECPLHSEQKCHFLPSDFE